MAKILVLGSSSTFPFPRTVTNRFSDYSDIEGYTRRFKLHDDPICNLAKKGGKEKRTRSSLAIILDTGTILIDAGPDILYQIGKYEVNPDVVLITHNHADADFGLKFLGRAVRVLRETDGSLKVAEKLKIFGLEITPFRVNHAAEIPTFGFKITSGKTQFAYMSDLANLEGIRKWITDCDFVFADGSNLAQNQPTHLSIIDQLRSYRKWGIKKVIFTHIGHKTLPHEELLKYCREIYRPISIAYDGLSFTV